MSTSPWTSQEGFEPSTKTVESDKSDIFSSVLVETMRPIHEQEVKALAFRKRATRFIGLSSSEDYASIKLEEIRLQAQAEWIAAGCPAEKVDDVGCFGGLLALIVFGGTLWLIWEISNALF